jgi:predicted 3-demethylubiquinone-9 3-methyltransferase (glyoxalase superfamily)
MQKIIPSFWFDQNAEEAMDFYISVFPDSAIDSIKRYPDQVPDGPMKGMEGKVLHGQFSLMGYTFTCLDGGPLFTPNPSISFFVNCGTAEEVNEYWQKLSDGGQALMELAAYPHSPRYGWVKDKFGISWQIMQTNPDGDMRPAIIPSLMFVGDKFGRAAEARDFYISVFGNSTIGNTAPYPDGEPAAKGAVMYEDFTLEGQWFAAMDGPGEHAFGFNEAISFYVDCADQAEVDRLWASLSANPEAEQCGWLKDKFGVSWQIIPAQMGDLLNGSDEAGAGRAMQAMLGMKKIDLAALQRAYDGSES